MIGRASDVGAVYVRDARIAGLLRLRSIGADPVGTLWGHPWGHGLVAPRRVGALSIDMFEGIRLRAGRHGCFHHERGAAARAQNSMGTSARRAGSSRCGGLRRLRSGKVEVSM